MSKGQSKLMTREELAELRSKFNAELGWIRKEKLSLMDTLSAALDVVEAAKTVQRYYHGDIDAQGALSELDKALAPFMGTEGGKK